MNVEAVLVFLTCVCFGAGTWDYIGYTMWSYPQYHKAHRLRCWLWFAGFVIFGILGAAGL